MLLTRDEFDKLEALRIGFTLADLSFKGTFTFCCSSRPISDVLAGISEHLIGASQTTTNDDYLHVLQMLSPSSRMLHEAWALGESDDIFAPNAMDLELLKRTALKDVHAKGSVQITGRPGYGKSTFVKLIIQMIEQRSSPVVISNFLDSSRRLLTSYGVCVSFLRQIISQRPSLFRLVRNLMVEMIRREAWTKENLQILLVAILHHSRDMEFLIVIYDYEDWPSEIRLWWSETLRPLMSSLGVTFTFLTSSLEPISGLSSKPHNLNLEKYYGQYREEFIRAKVTDLLDRGYSLVSSGDRLSDYIRKTVLPRAKSFQGSLTSINAYLVLLFQTFTLNTPDSITSQIEASPQTEDELYEQEIERIVAKCTHLSWVASALSWMLRSVRPLRIEELAVATAVNLGHSSISSVHQTVSRDMERDLRSHLGPIIAIENRYGRITSVAARRILSTNRTRRSLKLHDHDHLTKLCLNYIGMVLRDQNPKTWEKCLSYISWKHQTLDPHDPAMEFLDYAFRFWPAHFLLVTDPDKSLKDTIINFLLAPRLANRWFQMYLFCSARASDPPEDHREAIEAAKIVLDHDSAAFKKPDIDSLDDAKNVRQSAIRIASDLGLISIIPELLDDSTSIGKAQAVNIRHSFLERNVVFLDTNSQYYLDCAISNDDHSMVKSLLDSDKK